MISWHTKDSHNEDTLDSISLAAYQLRTPPTRSPNSQKTASYASPCGNPYRSTYAIRSDAYRAPCASSKRGVACACVGYAEESATSNRKNTLGRHSVQRGGLLDTRANDRNLRGNGQARLQGNAEAFPLGHRDDGCRTTTGSY